MVELMPMKGNTGRASTKVQSGRSKHETLSNNYNETFGQQMEQLTSEQESLRLLRKDSGDGAQHKIMKVPASANQSQEQLPAAAKKVVRKKASTMNIHEE